ncbi:TPA: dipeptidyl aminopeptidase, partial [bacterium]|nr:dipeptidyl aminopeptidase [bacterium]
DNRFRFGVPVYGCGFLGENSCWLPVFEQMGKQKAKKWLDLWDPSHYLKNATMPMLWVTGTNDFAYPMDSLQKSYRVTKGKRTLCIRVRMPHGHGGAGENPEEIKAFADSILKNGEVLAEITNQGIDKDIIWANFNSSVPIVNAELCFTTDSGDWFNRMWFNEQAELDTVDKKAYAKLPEGTTVAYLNLIDEKGLIVSTEHLNKF